MNQETYLRELLHKFRSNQISAEEAAILFDLLRQLPAGKQYLAQLMEEAAQQDLEYINRQEAGFSAEGAEVDTSRSQRMQEKILHRIGSMQTADILQKRERNKERWQRIWRVAAVLLLICGLGIGIYQTRRHTQPITYSTYTTGNGKMATITLPDGTVIRLNQNSSIRYPENFTAHSLREIHLSGEAFFEVAKNPEKPFVITTEESRIRVLGTAFNVKENRHDTTVIVAVREGLVAFSSRIDSTRNRTQLSKGEIGVLHRSALQQHQSNDISNYLSWYNGRLVFRNTPLPDVVQQLSQCYDTPIQIQHPELMSLRLTADMKRDSLPAVLEQLALSLNIRYSHKKGIFHLYHK